MHRIIKRDRSIIPACDVSLGLYETIVKETADIDGIGGYKIGFVLGLTHGLPKVVEVARRYTDKPIIYDHQKACTDIPDTGAGFAKTCKDAGVDAIILFPQSGPETEAAWIKACKAEGLGVIVGGIMSHPKYIRSEGGYIADEAVLEIYLTAADLGVVDFVVPGNRPDDIKRIMAALKKRGIAGVFYSPGFVAQGGSISDTLKMFGANNWHPIVGRGIYNAKNIKEATLEYTRLL
ncbi:MAG: orotidine 5'-phosphate decarboxylase / HUMPS family protein [Candidatus Anammoxibacter sp.]